MLVLGIETSCDETAAAVVRDGKEILSSTVQSQVDLHEAFGGVVPEVACRAHIEAIIPVVGKSLKDAGVGLPDIEVIAVTHTPGLVGALLIGVSAAKALALALERPIVGVDHIHAHLYANRLAFPDLPYPCVGLVASGGHTSLYLSRSETEHELLGATHDDAAGEAFDKVAKMLGLGFPGGPAIDRAARGRDPKRVPFRRTMLGDASLDFSFSGIKTAVLYRVRGQDAKAPRKLDEEERADVAAGFQEAVVDVLVEKCVRACRRTGVGWLAVGGGVACNSRLREKAAERAKEEGIEVRFPPAKFCTDNAAMVAGLGHHLYLAGRVADLRLDAVATKDHSR